VAESESAWLEPARQAVMAALSPLAADGRLSKNGMKGMVTAGTVLVEFVGEDGDDWHTIIGFPSERYRDGVVHLELLRRFIHGAEGVDGDDD
jgi:hypothetical protein